VFSKLHCFIHFLAALALVLASAGMAQAQSAAPAAAAAAPVATPVATTATLRGHIADQTGALIPGATVTVSNAAGKTVATATADSGGLYVVNNLAPGAYKVTATYAGFAPFVSPAVQLAAGQALHMKIAMAIEAEQQSVVVTDESPTVNIEASGNASSVVIKGKDLDALSDDPDELSSELTALAGPSAGPNGGQIYIDGFTGGNLPPKSAIREIRINQNPYSAEFDHLGYGRIEILTKPGTDKLHGQFFAMGNDKSFNTGSPVAQNIPDYHSYQFNGTLNGSLSKNASFFVSAERRNTQNANTYDAQIAIDANNKAVYQIGALINPHMRTNASARVDLQLGQKNTLTARYQYYRNNDNDDLGSTIALPTQATTTTSTEHTVQLSDALVISDHIVNETRFQYLRDTSTEIPSTGVTNPASYPWAANFSVTSPSTSVQGDFTTGGSSSQKSNDHDDHFELQNVTTMSLGAHAIKFGTRLRDNREATSSTSGFNGSFTFASLPDFNTVMTDLNGKGFGSVTDKTLSASTLPQKLNYTTGPGGVTTPTGYVGNVFDAALFFQDDWKVNKMLTVSGGLRWESQNHTADHSDWAPRVALAYAVDGHKTGKTKTVLRAGYGLFYDRFGLSSEMDLISEGGGSNSLVQNSINAPTCFATTYFDNLSSEDIAKCIPSGSSASTGSSTNTIQIIAPNYHAPYTQQFGASIERQLNKATTLTATYLHSYGVHQMATINANAFKPEQGTFFYNSTTGERQDTNATCLAANNCPGIEDEYLSEAVFKQNQLILNVNAKITSNFNVMGFYNLSAANADTGTASNSYYLQQDYGRASFVSRNMLFLMANYQAPWGIRLNPMVIANSGKPYNIITNNDLTGDNFFNNRPARVGPNSSPSCVYDPKNPSLRYVQTSYGCLDTQPTSDETLLPINKAMGPSAVTANLRVSRSFGIGPKLTSANNQDGGPGGPPPGGGGGRGGPGGPGGGPGGGFGPGGFGGSSGRPPHGMFDSPASHKYNLTFSAQVQNVFNTVNYGTPSGTIIPTLADGVVGPGARFGQSTSLAGGPFSSNAAVRRIFFQATFAF